MGSSSESWEPYQRPHPWHLRAGWRSRPQHQYRSRSRTSGAAETGQQRRSAGIRLVEVGDHDLLHLHHGLHGAIGLLAIRIPQVTAEGRGHNLPGQAEFVLEPSAFRFLAAVGDQSVPEVVHLLLALDADEERV